jgi:hypothetical protein
MEERGGEVGGSKDKLDRLLRAGIICSETEGYWSGTVFS